MDWNCLGSLVVLSATAMLEVLGSIPGSSKKCYWDFLWNSQWQLGVWVCARLMAIGSPPITWDLNIPANCGCTLVHLCLTLRGIQAWLYVCMCKMGCMKRRRRCLSTSGLSYTTYNISILCYTVSHTTNFADWLIFSLWQELLSCKVQYCMILLGGLTRLYWRIHSY